MVALYLRGGFPRRSRFRPQDFFNIRHVSAGDGPATLSCLEPTGETSRQAGMPDPATVGGQDISGVFAAYNQDSQRAADPPRGPRGICRPLECTSQVAI